MVILAALSGIMALTGLSFLGGDVKGETEETSPSTIDGWLKQGRHAIEQGDYAAAGHALSTILQLSGNKSSDPRVTAFGSVVMAYGVWQQHPDQIPLIQQHLQSAIDKDPAWAYPYFFLARVLSYPEPTNQIIPVIENALTLDPSLAKAEDFGVLAILYNRKQDYPNAIQAAQHGIERFPTEPMLHMSLAESLISTNKPLDGFYELQYAIFIGGSKHPVFVKVKEALHGLIVQYRNERGRQQQPELFSCLEAFRLQSEKRFSDSIPLFQQALSMRPEPHPLLHLFLGEAYLQNNQLEAGIQELKLVTAANPWFAPPYAELGDAYEALKDYESASEWWNRGIAADSTNWKSQQAKASIEHLAKKSKVP